MWIIIFFVLLRNRKAVIVRKIIKKRKTEGNTEMKELAKRFMNKECVIAVNVSYTGRGGINEE